MGPPGRRHPPNYNLPHGTGNFGYTRQNVNKKSRGCVCNTVLSFKRCKESGIVVLVPILLAERIAGRVLSRITPGYALITLGIESLNRLRYFMLSSSKMKTKTFPKKMTTRMLTRMCLAATKLRCWKGYIQGRELLT